MGPIAKLVTRCVKMGIDATAPSIASVIAETVNAELAACAGAACAVWNDELISSGTAFAGFSDEEQDGSMYLEYAEPWRVTIPAHTAPIWENGRCVNKGGLPLWSGKGEPPAIGSTVTCNDKVATLVTVTGYVVDGGWLLAEGYRTADPSKTGNLAGAEIRYQAEC